MREKWQRRARFIGMPTVRSVMTVPVRLAAKAWGLAIPDSPPNGKRELAIDLTL